VLDVMIPCWFCDTPWACRAILESCQTKLLLELGYEKEKARDLTCASAGNIERALDLDVTGMAFCLVQRRAFATSNLRGSLMYALGVCF
jgi:hypothetical protein